jgi:hypothetical protein
MTVYASIRPESGGAGTGLAAHVTISPSAAGEPQAFHGVVTGENAVSDDQCDITWVANTAATS